MRLRRFWISLLALMLWGCAGTATPPVQSSVVPRAARVVVPPARPDPRFQQALSGFFTALRAVETGRASHLRILQLGDSHTAADFLSGQLRDRFQERFGRAGRGMQPPGLAYVGLRQKDTTVTETGSWIIRNSLTMPSKGPYGISGFDAVSGQRGASMSLAPTDGTRFDRAAIEYIARPGGGRFDVLLDGRVVRTITMSGTGLRRIEIAAPAPGASRLEIVARSRGVTIASWGLESDRPGVLLDSFGVVSATAGLYTHWDPEVVRAEVTALRPALIILAYGTNEGFRRDFDPAAYARIFSGLIDALRRAAPSASILVVGPPDGQRHEDDCGASTPRSDPSCGWATPPALGLVRGIQQAEAARVGAAFWDWSSLMSEPGGIDRWANLSEPLARMDHVHFTVAGYELAADALFGQLMANYAAFEGGSG